MDRRSFLKNAGFAAVGASAAVMGLAGCSAGGSGSDADSVAWDEEFDVVVVGGGNAGEFCAKQVAEAGLSTVVLEVRDEDLPKNGSYWTEAACIMVETGEEEVTLTAEEIYQFFLDSGLNILPDVCRNVAYRSGDVYRILTGLGIEFNAIVMPLVHPSDPVFHVPPCCGKGILEALRAAGEAAGRKYYKATRARHLVQDADGRVIGVVAETADGIKRYKANAAVVLACGGYMQGKEVLAAFGPLNSEKAWSCTCDTDRGDGLMMGLEVGGAPWNVAIGVGTNGYYVKGKQIFYDPVWWVPNRCASRGAVFVGMDGKRFANDSDANAVTTKILATDEGFGFIVVNEEMRAGMGEISHLTIPVGTVEPSDFDLKGDTLEDLAGSIASEYPSFDKTAFLATMGLYNADFAAGADTVHGRPITEALLSLASGPYYACPVGAGQNVTQGGLKIDGSGRVLRFADDQPIPGLYAIGVTSGGINASPTSITGSSITGTSALKGMTLGLAAAEDIIAAQSA